MVGGAAVFAVRRLDSGMADRQTRETVLAATFERLAADLRDGRATVYGYDVRTGDHPRERGGVAFSGGWLSFEFEADGADGE